MKKNPLIKVSDLAYRYETKYTFRDVNVEMNQGDFIAIIGANGSGKSTFMRLLLGEQEIQEGKIELFGKPVERFDDWNRIGYVPQNALARYVNFPATVMEVVRANLYDRKKRVGRKRKVEQATALSALREVEMQDYKKRMLSELSGGQLQRVMLASVLVGDPELLILDEPTTGVDAHTVDLLYKKLAELNHETGRTIVMVTHDLARVAKYVTRVFCLDHGSLVELEDAQVAEELSHRHSHPHVEGI